MINTKYPEFFQNAEILYENTRAKHSEEMSVLTSNYEARLLELRKTVDHLNETSNDIVQEKSVLKALLSETREENISLKSDYKIATERNKELQNKLKVATEALQVKPIDVEEPKKDLPKEKKQTKTKSEQTVRFASEVTEIFDVSEWQ